MPRLPPPPHSHRRVVRFFQQAPCSWVRILGALFRCFRCRQHFWIRHNPSECHSVYSEPCPHRPGKTEPERTSVFKENQDGTWCCDGMVYHHLMGWYSNGIGWDVCRNKNKTARTSVRVCPLSSSSKFGIGRKNSTVFSVPLHMVATTLSRYPRPLNFGLSGCVGRASRCWWWQ